ncbi:MULTISPECIES: hypothetical protein [Burkholderia cepacia complex]|uniref:hypothetical protein n=1 Tax=Burkholderia cepacia complex TaxID=87882 RepID=UPI001589B09F|nr:MULTISPECIES: hypothetical protein [Burkholderia cepacia complex]MBY4834061.1 hypothetical protein [Burkholderia dolosa]MDN7949510.1 hypothetical protein [Burkholderia multivorans]
MILRKLVYIFSVVTPVLLSGCATNYGTATSNEVSKSIVVENSSFDAAATYTGPPVISETRRGLFVDNETTRLVATRNKSTGGISYIVYVRVLYSFDWRFYQSVSFRDGAQSEVKPLSRETHACQGMGCLHTEEVAFKIEKSKIASGGDFEFRLNAKSGTQNIIKIPQSYIEGFLKGLPPEFAG